MLFRNPDMDQAFNFIANSDFDVFCIQEAPEPFVERLRTLPFHLDAAIEMEQTFEGGPVTRYLVVLSRYPLTRVKHVPLPALDSMRTWRAYFFITFMTLIRVWGDGTGNRHSQIVDVALPAGTLRVFNLHLPLLTPAHRMKEFELALAERDKTLPTIVCGDFNILEHPRITILTWLFGGSLTDTIRYTLERTRIEDRFIEHGLTNVLRGKKTHRISASQLDHILVSPHFSLKNAEVLPDAHGSDHQPIFAEVA
jgi:endonuclease/exonuclease/phosphatase family metal-dependent hydrolase